MRERSFFGVDGETAWGSHGRLSAEFGYSAATETGATELGAGLRFESSAELGRGLDWKLRGELTRGVLTMPDGRTRPAGTELTTSFSYRLNGSTLTYERGLTKKGAASATHRDELRLTTALGGIGLRAGVAAAGSQFLPSADRGLKLYSEATWKAGTAGTKEGLGVKMGVEANRTHPMSEWRWSAPVELTYRTSRGVVDASLGYRYAIGSEKPGIWLASLERGNGRGSTSYTRLELAGAASNWVTGTRHDWELTDGLHLALSGEGRTGTSGGHLVAAWNLRYEWPTVDLRLQAGQQYRRSGGWQQTTHVSGSGSVRGTFTYQLNGWWLTGDDAAIDARRTLRNEWTAAVGLDDLEQSRHTVTAQAIRRSYILPETAGLPRMDSLVYVASLDGAYHVEHHLGITAKLAWKQEENTWRIAGGADSQATTVRLAQLGLEIPVAERFTMELFGRRLWDSTGADVSGYALEWVYRLTDGIGFAVGVSTLGLNDPDLSAVAPWPDGFYARLRLGL